jgi:bifunctional DNase/RNase
VSDRVVPTAGAEAEAGDLTDRADGSEDQVMVHAADTPDVADHREAPVAVESTDPVAGAGAGAEAGSADATRPATPAPTDRRRGGAYRMAIVSAVTMDLPNQHPAVVLRETESPRRQLTFSVGLQDGIALSYALRRVPTPRPLTHELMGEVLAGFDIDVVAVRLVGRTGATYFAELDLRGRNARSVHSCRPTDALTLALRQPVPVPILIDSRLFESAGDVEPPTATA